MICNAYISTTHLPDTTAACRSDMILSRSQKRSCFSRVHSVSQQCTGRYSFRRYLKKGELGFFINIFLIFFENKMILKSNNLSIPATRRESPFHLPPLGLDPLSVAVDVVRIHEVLRVVDCSLLLVPIEAQGLKPIVT